MNYQLLQISHTNYQLDQNRALNYHSYILCPLPSVRAVKIDGQRVMCGSHAILMIFLPLLPSVPQSYPFLFIFFISATTTSPKISHLLFSTSRIYKSSMSLTTSSSGKSLTTLKSFSIRFYRCGITSSQVFYHLTICIEAETQ
jgi:hypothetical protein